MRISLDDRREFPKGSFYSCVRSYKDCVLLISVFKKLDFISLDYDLSEEKTGYDVLVFMKENGVEVPHINIHSDNEIGKPMMKKYIEENFPKARLTFNPLEVKN